MSNTTTGDEGSFDLTLAVVLQKRFEGAANRVIPSEGVTLTKEQYDAIAESVPMCARRCGNRLLITDRGPVCFECLKTSYA